jgi:hypothetical protein
MKPPLITGSLGLVVLEADQPLGNLERDFKYEVYLGIVPTVSALGTFHFVSNRSEALWQLSFCIETFRSILALMR